MPSRFGPLAASETWVHLQGGKNVSKVTCEQVFDAACGLTAFFRQTPTPSVLQDASYFASTPGFSPQTIAEASWFMARQSGDVTGGEKKGGGEISSHT